MGNRQYYCSSILEWWKPETQLLLTRNHPTQKPGHHWCKDEFCCWCSRCNQRVTKHSGRESDRRLTQWHHSSSLLWRTHSTQWSTCRRTTIMSHARTTVLLGLNYQLVEPIGQCWMPDSIHPSWRRLYMTNGCKHCLEIGMLDWLGQSLKLCFPLLWH